MLQLILIAALAADDVREWADTSGDFSVTASLVEVIDQRASLKEPDGTAIWVPVSRLSKADRDYLNETHKKRIALVEKGIASRRAYQKKHRAAGNDKGAVYEMKFIGKLNAELAVLKKGDIPRRTVPPPLPKKPKKPPPPPPPVPELDPLALAVGQKGRLLVRPRNARHLTFRYRVVQVSGDGILVRVRIKWGTTGQEEYGPLLFLSGIRTDKLVDDQIVVPPPIVHVKGVKRYETVTGSVASVLHLVPATMQPEKK